MTTPAILYDHVPIVEKKKDLNSDDDAQSQPSIFSLRSYFVTKMIHQVSAPPEDADDSKQGRREKEDEIQQSRLPHTPLQEEDDDEESDDNVSVSVPMETIWEDSVCTEYVFVPNSALSDDRALYDDCSRLTTLPTSRIHKLRCVLKSLFSTSPLTNTLAMEKKDDTSASSVFLDPLRYVSAYLRSYLPTTNISASSHRRQVWASESSVDTTGNRLILPPASSMMDSTHGDLAELDHSPFHSPLSPMCWNDDSYKEDGAEGALIVPPTEGGNGQEEDGDPQGFSIATAHKSSRSWWPTITTRMVPAHELLVEKRQQLQQPATRPDRRIGLKSSSTSSSIWIVSEGEDNSKVAKPRQFSQHPQLASLPSNVEQTIVFHTWTSAIWKFAKRKTMRLCRLSYYHAHSRVKQLGRSLLHDTTIHQSQASAFRTVPCDPAGNVSFNGSREKSCDEGPPETAYLEGEVEVSIHTDTIEMTTLRPDQLV